MDLGVDLRVVWLSAVHQSVRAVGGGVIGDVLKPADLVDLARGKRDDIAHHQPLRVGDVVFHWFD